MTSIFNEIKVVWNEREYVIPPDSVMMLIARVEDVITLAELSRCADKKTLPLAKLSQAFAYILQHAGASVTAEDVYAGMFKGSMRQNAEQAVTTLLIMMLPPAHLQASAEEVAANAGKEKGAESQSLKKRTK